MFTIRQNQSHDCNVRSQDVRRHITISAAQTWWSINWTELWEYRELIGLLARRDFVAKYKQTILGSLWYVLQPLLQSIMFIFVFTSIARLPTGGVPPMLFYLSGTVLWRYFSECVSSTATTFTRSQQIFDKVYFPRLAVPLSQLIMNMAGLAMGLILFFGFYIFFKIRGASVSLDWRIVVLPLLIFQMAALGLGVGCLITSFTNRFRDLQMLLGFFLQLWMYASCVVYPLSAVPEAYRWLLELNPIVFVVESFRFSVFGEGTVTLRQVLLGLGVSVAILVIGLLSFNHTAKTSVDTA